jgi:hypothetical protein
MQDQFSIEPAPEELLVAARNDGLKWVYQEPGYRAVFYFYNGVVVMNNELKVIENEEQGS